MIIDEEQHDISTFQDQERTTWHSGEFKIGFNFKKKQIEIDEPLSKS